MQGTSQVLFDDIERHFPNPYEFPSKIWVGFKR